MIDDEVDGYRHLDWLERIGLYETAYFTSFYYIEIGAIGFNTEHDYDSSEDWLYRSKYDDDDWYQGRKRQLQEVRKINRRHSHRFRKKNDY